MIVAPSSLVLVILTVLLKDNDDSRKLVFSHDRAVLYMNSQQLRLCRRPAEGQANQIQVWMGEDLGCPTCSWGAIGNLWLLEERDPVFFVCLFFLFRIAALEKLPWSSSWSHTHVYTGRSKRRGAVIFKKKESIWCWEGNMWRGEVLEKAEHRGWHRIRQKHHMLFQNSQTKKKGTWRKFRKKCGRGIEEGMKGW